MFPFRRVLLLVFFATAILIPRFDVGAKEPGPTKLYGFCMDMPAKSAPSIASQAKLLKELGFDGVGYPLWFGQELDENLKTLDAVGLPLHLVYMSVNLNPEQPAYDLRVPESFARLKGRPVVVSVQIRGFPPGDPRGMERAVKVLRELADLGAQHGLKLSIYHHLGDWTESLLFALKVVEQVDRSNLGVNFNLCHWLRVDGDKDYRPVLRENAERIFAVTINGAQVGATEWTGGLIQPLDQGDFDNRALLATLQEIGYAGPIGLMCWGIPDDTRDHLERSMRVWKSWQKETTEKLSGLLENEDCTDIFFTETFPEGKAGEVIDNYVDVLAGAGVTVLLCNTNARRTNYRSDVWQSFWDGYDPAGPDDQPFLAPLRPEQRATYRKLIHNMYEVDRQGVDYPARVIARCRHRGVSPWISLRMNDVHNNDNLEHPFHSMLWRKPELFRKGHPGYFARGLDYAHAEVRDYYMALVRETLDRYDLDGLELDFMREPFLFSVGEEQAGAAILTGWIRQVRGLVDKAAQRRGHLIRLGVRVPFDPETALGLGLDAPTWSREGLVDLVTVAPRWRTMVFNHPMGRWRELLGDRVTLAGGLEVRYYPYPGAEVVMMDPENAVGAAMAILSGGGDVVYLFNYFQNSRWPKSEYQALLSKFLSLDELARLPRRHAVAVPEIFVPGKPFKAVLPATGSALSFDLPLGPRPAGNRKVEVSLEVTGEEGDDPPTVKVNQVAGERKTAMGQGNGRRVLTFVVPAEAVSGNNSDTIEVVAPEGGTVTAYRVEVCIDPGG